MYRSKSSRELDFADSNEASNSDEAPGNGSVLQTVKSVVLQMIRSVTGSSPSSVQGSPPAAEDSDGKDGRHEESMDVDEAGLFLVTVGLLAG